MLNERPIIAVAGALAVGKSTLAEKLAGCLGYELLPEQFADNPYLPAYYRKEAVFFLVEQWFIEHDEARQKQALAILAAGGRGVVLDKPLAGNHAWVDAAGDMLTKAETRLCHEMIRERSARLSVTLVLDLRAPDDVLMERVRARARGMEQTMKPEFMIALCKAHEANEHEWGDTPRIIISTDSCNFIAQPELVGRLTDRVGDVLAGRHPRISVFS